MRNIWFIFILLFFSSCSLKFGTQNLIGYPTHDLDVYKTRYSVILDQNQELVYNSLIDFLKEKDIDIYKKEKYNRIYVRNMDKIFINCINSTCMGIYLENYNAKTKVTLVSKNHELASFFKDKTPAIVSYEKES